MLGRRKTCPAAWPEDSVRRRRAHEALRLTHPGAGWFSARVAMPIHRVVQGERISSIAQLYGFGDDKAIYEHPDNEELRKKRPNPNVLLEGDRVVIPDRAAKELECAAGKMHRFQVRLPRS